MPLPGEQMPGHTAGQDPFHCLARDAHVSPVIPVLAAIPVLVRPWRAHTARRRIRSVLPPLNELGALAGLTSESCSHWLT
jgi:hypothetical protein